MFGVGHHRVLRGGVHAGGVELKEFRVGGFELLLHDVEPKKELWHIGTNCRVTIGVKDGFLCRRGRRVDAGHRGAVDRLCGCRR